MKIAVGAILKNEREYLLEWYSHYRRLGIENFFLADNESNDGSFVLLEGLAAFGFEVFSIGTMEDGATQTRAYSAILEQARAAGVEVLLFLDLDEYLLLDDGWQNLEDFCRARFSDPEVGGIAVNWRCFGSGGKMVRLPGLVVDRFSTHFPIEEPVNRHYKSIVRLAAVKGPVNPHHFELAEGFVYQDASGGRLTISRDGLGLSEAASWKGAVINHYVVKSWGEFLEKKSSRGRATTNQPRNWEHYYSDHDGNTEQTFYPADAARLEGQILRETATRMVKQGVPVRSVDCACMALPGLLLHDSEVVVGSRIVHVTPLLSSYEGSGIVHVGLDAPTTGLWVGVSAKPLFRYTGWVALRQPRDFRMTVSPGWSSYFDYLEVDRPDVRRHFAENHPSLGVEVVQGFDFQVPLHGVQTLYLDFYTYRVPLFQINLLGRLPS